MAQNVPDKDVIALKAALIAQAEFAPIAPVCALHGDSRSAIYRDPQRHEYLRKRGRRTLIHVPSYRRVRAPQKAV